ncbi:hypothetical protein PP101_16 [Pectobacterium phage PP101]|uniref:Uncharacterized protein n=1 Tax=Pectobacterium phage PP101 TaxID=1916414 RepID=A0A1J0MEY3_9CAUD|nr:hypothetical protein HOR42_gp16 [Pectobacterium phage PP101]APD19680.2 hypothetical protein PP101_16 [Pectobacterium phage PP101]
MCFMKLISTNRRVLHTRALLSTPIASLSMKMELNVYFTVSLLSMAVKRLSVTKDDLDKPEHEFTFERPHVSCKFDEAEQLRSLLQELGTGLQDDISRHIRWMELWGSTSAASLTSRILRINSLFAEEYRRRYLQELPIDGIWLKPGCYEGELV